MREQQIRYYAKYAEALTERFAHAVLKELQTYNHFVVWKKTPENKKIPFDPKSQMHARTDTPDTWGNLEQALKALGTGKYQGIGFMFAQDDPFTGIDIDHCVNNGTIIPEAQALVTDFRSYTEYSPSKTGLHILVQGTVPESRRKNGMEIYSTGRYFTITTNHVKDTPMVIEHRQEVIEALYQRFVPLQSEQRGIQNTRWGVESGSALTELPAEAERDILLQRLLRGDTTGFASASNADFVLILKLLHWTGDNVDLTRKLFLTSGLYREEKSERKTGKTTYVDMTIYNALKKRRNPPMRR
jgi:primase-polymerase (primpol)-like protein